MKLGDVLILSLALAFIIIGIHQALTVGITGSYTIFMMAVALLFWFQLRKTKRSEQTNKQEPIKKTKRKN